MLIFRKAVVPLVVTLVAGWCVLSIIAGPKHNMDRLVGAESYCCWDCVDVYSHFYECYHELSMDPEVELCWTDACLENWHWYFACQEGWGDCETYYDPNALYGYQERKWDDCSHSGEDPFYRQQSTPCAPNKGEYVRCITESCTGTSWGTFSGYGLEKCLE